MSDKLHKLSDAIKLGSTFLPQAFNAYFNYNEGDFTASCALGAAMHATGVDSDGFVFFHTPRIALKRYAECLGSYQNCPDSNCPMPPLPLQMVIAHLNDNHKWTREKIADWLAEQGY